MIGEVKRGERRGMILGVEGGEISTNEVRGNRGEVFCGFSPRVKLLL